MLISEKLHKNMKKRKDKDEEEEDTNTEQLMDIPLTARDNIYPT